jgi:hypothetical protein
MKRGDFVTTGDGIVNEVFDYHEEDGRVLLHGSAWRITMPARVLRLATVEEIERAYRHGELFTAKTTKYPNWEA